MRKAVENLVAMGPFPSASEAQVETLRRYEHLLAAIEPPITDEEAAALVGVFGPDDCYGLAWSLLHLVESAPALPIPDWLRQPRNEWTRRLRKRAENAGLLGRAPGCGVDRHRGPSNC